jgi:hypothetical protein
MALARRLSLDLRWALPILVLGLCACGSSKDQDRFNLTTPKPSATAGAGGGSGAAATERPVTRREEAVIRGWADTLRHGHVARAARYFALPFEWSNGTPLVRFSTRAQAELFNRELPCGARVVSLRRSPDGYVIATFRLTERPGPGSCGSGTDALAYTAFRIRHGRIVQWIRVPDASTTPSAIA